MDQVLGDGNGGGPDRGASRYLVVQMLGHWDTRYPAWAFVGLSCLPRAVYQDLGPEALAAVRRLRLVLFDRFTTAGQLGQAEIEPVAVAVHACGEWWPIPEISARMARDISGLDVPAVWGLEELRGCLRREMVDVRDHLNDRDRAKNLAKTLAATSDLVSELCAAIGGRYASRTAKPTAFKLDLAWRRFDAARAKSGGIMLLPLFGTQAARRAP
jgi:hypothetical protein